MSDGCPRSAFSVPFEMAVVRPLRRTTFDERRKALQAAGYNTELLSQEMIYIDLCTDSGVSALTTAQAAAFTGGSAIEPGMGLASQASRAFRLLLQEWQEIFGFPYLVPTTQGRAAERVWAKINVRPDTVVPGNILFPSTRAHIEMLGAKVVDVISDAAYELGSEAPFKGNLDVAKLEGALRQHGRENVSCIYIELSVNACGGHPVSLGNLKECKALARSYNVPLFLDASRILENGFHIKEREPGYKEHTIKEIIHEICGLADGMTLSALKDLLVPAGGMIGTRDQALYQKAVMQSFLDGVQPPGSVMEMIAIALREIFAAESHITYRIKQINYLWHRLVGEIPVVHPSGGHAVFVDVSSFLPHVAPEHHRAESLAAFVYQISGIRLTKGAPAAPSQVARGIELLRLAVPARKYIREHLDDVTEALLYAYEHRDEITGLREVKDPGKSKYEPRRFEWL